MMGLAVALAAVALAPASAQAADPTCNNINTGIVHNAATPLRITCTGADAGPVVKIITAPQHGTLNLPRAPAARTPG